MPLPYRWLTALMVRYNGSSQHYKNQDEGNGVKPFLHHLYSPPFNNHRLIHVS